MSAVLTHVYLIDLSIDLSNVDAKWIHAAWIDEINYRSIDNSRDPQETGQDRFCIILDKKSRTLTRQREFQDWESCDKRKAWLNNHIPIHMGIFTRTEVSSRDSEKLLTTGYITL